MSALNAANIINTWVENRLNLRFRIQNDVMAETGDAVCLADCDAVAGAEGALRIGRGECPPDQDACRPSGAGCSEQEQ